MSFCAKDIVRLNRRFAKHVLFKPIYGFHFAEKYIDVEFAAGASHKCLRFVNTTENSEASLYRDRFTRSHGKLLDAFASREDISISRLDENCECDFRAKSAFWPSHIIGAHVYKVLACELTRDDEACRYRREADVVMEGGIRCSGNVSIAISLEDPVLEERSLLVLRSDETLVQWNLLNSFN
jgi:hypothetical protein